MIGRIWRKLTRDQRGVTLTELVVTTTIIGILGAVVATGVTGSTTTANESSRAQLFAAVQGAVNSFAQTNLPADGDLTKAEYPFARSSSPFSTTATITLDGDPSKPDATVTTGIEAKSRDWYFADGRLLSPQPGVKSDGFPATDRVFTYVDLYSGGTDCKIDSSGDAGSYLTTSKPSLIKTDLRCLGSVTAPAGAAKSFGTPGTPGSVIRCIFVSDPDTKTNTTQIRDAKTKNIIRVLGHGSPATDASDGSITELRGGTDAAHAKAAVGANKGIVLACRDADPSGTGK